MFYKDYSKKEGVDESLLDLVYSVSLKNMRVSLTQAKMVQKEMKVSLYLKRIAQLKFQRKITNMKKGYI